MTTAADTAIDQALSEAHQRFTADNPLSLGRFEAQTRPCISARPGIRYLPRASTTVAPDGIDTRAAGPIAAMRPFEITTVWSLLKRSRSIGTIVTPVNASVPAAGCARSGP